MYVRLWVHAEARGIRSLWNWLRVIVSLGMGVLGTKLGSPARAVGTLQWVIFLAQTYFWRYHKQVPWRGQLKLPKFSSSQIWEATIKVSAGLPSSGDPHPRVKMPSSSCAFLSFCCVRHLLTSSYKDIGHTGFLFFLALLYFNFFFKHPLINTVALRGTTS